MQEAGVVEYNEGESLVFTVYDADYAKTRDLLGTAKLDCNMFDKGFHGELELDKAGKDKAYLMIKVRKADEEEYPPPPDQEITIELTKKEKKPHGLELDLSDKKTAYVLGVKAGPFKSYNDDKKPAQQLKAGDSIIKVNEEEGSAAKLDELMKSQANLVLKVRRSFKASIILDRKGKGKLGFEPKAVGNSLLITNVSADDGAMKQWNSDHPEQKVQEGDRIIAVGGQRGKGAQLAKKLNGIGPIQLTLECPARQEKKSGWFSML